MISDLSRLETKERYLYQAAIATCMDYVQKDNMQIKDAVPKVLSEFGPIVSDADKLNTVLFQEVSQEHSPHNVIKSAEVKNRHWWTDYKASKPENLDYWTRYEDYLMKKPGWSATSIKDIDESTDEVVNALADPTNGMPDERRGLVYGDVQSGKTAHYIGLINKAVSAGYKVIIVLSGMQNSLRSQTQSRIDEEVLGFETSNERLELDVSLQNSIGVGTIIATGDIKNQLPLQSLTTRDEKGDYNKNNSQGAYYPPYIIVTKKVKSPLTHILTQLRKTIAVSEDGKKSIPVKYPALIIDDEADQASINTKKNTDPEADPTTINGLIRKLLKLFQCRSYVGYTATPFANIFIPHRAENDVYGKDLFPKDFIAKAPRPELYVGAREFFGLGDAEDDSPKMPLIRSIQEGKDYLSGNKKDDPVGPIPSDLRKAIQYFIISTAVRNLRGQRNKPNTMLVHIIRLVDQQNDLKRRIRDYKDEQFNFIKYGDNEIKDIYGKIYREDYIPTTKELKTKFSKFMNGCDEIDFDEVWGEIARLAENNEIDVLAVNGTSSDSLMYKNHDGEPFNVIAIGGDKLSRGLTLEGLTISYFTRNASAMDTLMQMGRWFGYRPGYLDLCRLFTTDELATKFEIISYSVANLLDQFDDMNIRKSDPENFGLRIATDPRILISGRGRIRTGQDYKSDFSGIMTQTRLLDADPDIIEANYRAVDDLLSHIDQNRLGIYGHHTYEEETNRTKPVGKTFWTKVSGATIADFFDHYLTPRAATKASSRCIADYIREMNRHGGLIDWTVCLAGTSGTPTSIIATESQWPIKVHGVERNKDGGPTEYGKTTRDIHVLISNGDEQLDFDKDTLLRAEALKAELEGQGQTKQALSTEVRKQIRNFNHGFLILYPIEKAATDIKTKNNKAPYGFAAVFPDRKDIGNLKSYRLNEVAVELDDE